MQVLVQDLVRICPHDCHDPSNALPAPPARNGIHAISRNLPTMGLQDALAHFRFEGEFCLGCDWRRIDLALAAQVSCPAVNTSNCVSGNHIHTGAQTATFTITTTERLHFVFDCRRAGKGYVYKRASSSSRAALVLLIRAIYLARS